MVSRNRQIKLVGICDDSNEMQGASGPIVRAVGVCGDEGQWRSQEVMAALQVRVSLLHNMEALEAMEHVRVEVCGVWCGANLDNVDVLRTALERR